MPALDDGPSAGLPRVYDIALETIAEARMGNPGNRHGLFAGGLFPQIGNAVFGDNDNPIIGTGRKTDPRRVHLGNF